jgi:DNA repair protein RadA/Sms
VVAFGEISLAGEIRKVNQAVIRQNEAKRLGFTTVIDSNFTQLTKALAAGLKN